MKIRIDFNLGFVLPDGSESGLEKQNKALSGQLAVMTTGDPVKLWGWAVDLSKTGVLELDESDFSSLLKIVEGSQNLTILAKVQLMQTIKDARTKVPTCGGS